MEVRRQVLIADDHLIFADALKLLLEKHYLVVGTVADGQSMVSTALKLKPDVIIVDVGMPFLNGLDAARRVRELLPRVRLVFLTMQDNPNLAAAALELGNVGFVLKQSAGSELLTAIGHVLEGKSYVTPKLRADDWVISKSRARQFSADLTRRQREIVQMCAEGRPLKEIAIQLNLSLKTVEFHKHHIMEIFHLKSTPDLVIFALQQGLIPLERPAKK
jgi:DNA-binding NarL/FixJ family response regulator